MSANPGDKRNSEIAAKIPPLVVILVVLCGEKLTTLALDRIFNVTLEDTV